MAAAWTRQVANDGRVNKAEGERAGAKEESWVLFLHLVSRNGLALV